MPSPDLFCAAAGELEPGADSSCRVGADCPEPRRDTYYRWCPQDRRRNLWSLGDPAMALF